MKYPGMNKSQNTISFKQHLPDIYFPNTAIYVYMYEIGIFHYSSGSKKNDKL